MNRSFIAGIVFLVTAFSQAMGEEVAAPKIVLDLPPGMECQAVIQMSAASFGGKLPPSMPAKRIFLFTGQDASRSIESVDGKVVTEFVRGNYLLGWDSKRGIQVEAFGPDSGAEDFRKVHFPELQWVKDATYRGLERSGDLRFHLFENAEGRKLKVNPETLLPTAYESPLEKYFYTYRKTGQVGAKIPLVPELQARWDKIKANALRYQKVRIED